MLPLAHVAYGSFFSILIYILFPQIGALGIFFIFAASVLIDIDHYFASLIAGNGFSLKKAYHWFLGQDQDIESHVQKWFIPFHSIEFFFIMFLVWLFSNGIFADIVLYTFIGCLIHMILDLIELYNSKYPMYLKLSCVYIFFKHRHLVKVLIKSKSKTFKY